MGTAVPPHLPAPGVPTKGAARRRPLNYRCDGHTRPVLLTRKPCAGSRAFFRKLTGDGRVKAVTKDSTWRGAPSAIRPRLAEGGRGEGGSSVSPCAGACAAPPAPRAA